MSLVIVVNLPLSRDAPKERRRRGGRGVRQNHPMKKIDLKKALKDLYSPPSKKVVVVDVPPLTYIMIDGEGDPNTSQQYQDAIEVLYALSFTLKFALKRGEAQIDYVVMPLEGLWWGGDTDEFDIDDKDTWKWTSMILQPEPVTPELFAEAVEEVRKKNPVALEKARLEELHEGLSAQIMHIGPYAEEAPTVEKLHSFIRDSGCEFNGKHHEIYLSDPRRAAPEKLKTIIRQPIQPASA